MPTVIDLQAAASEDREKELWHWLCQREVLKFCLLARVESISGEYHGHTVTLGNATTLGGYEINAELRGYFCPETILLSALTCPSNKEEHERLLAEVKPGTCWLVQAEMLLMAGGEPQLMDTRYVPIPPALHVAARNLFRKQASAGSPREG